MFCGLRTNYLSTSRIDAQGRRELTGAEDSSNSKSHFLFMAGRQRVLRMRDGVLDAEEVHGGISGKRSNGVWWLNLYIPLVYSCFNGSRGLKRTRLEILLLDSGSKPRLCAHGSMPIGQHIENPIFGRYFGPVNNREYTVTQIRIPTSIFGRT